MLRMRTLAALLILAAAAAGCGPAERKGVFASVSLLPHVAVDGALQKVGPGYGIELDFLFHRADYGFDAEAWGGVNLAWSHHEAAPGRPEAECFRLGVDIWSLTNYWTGSAESRVRFGGEGTVGMKLHYLMADGPGDTGGIGPSINGALFLKLGPQAFLSAGCGLDLWVAIDGSPVSTFTPFVRFGVQF